MVEVDFKYVIFQKKKGNKETKRLAKIANNFSKCKGGLHLPGRLNLHPYGVVCSP